MKKQKKEDNKLKEEQNIQEENKQEENNKEIEKDDTQPENTKSKNNIVVTLLIQFILSIITLVILIIYFFNKNFMAVLQISLGLTMLITGYNNFFVYKRKFLTLVYFIVGLLLLALAVITIMGI